MPIDHAPTVVDDQGSLSASQNAKESTFLKYFKSATSCCCGCVSLKHAVVSLTVFDLTLGLSSAGIVFMVLEEKLEPSSFLAIVCVNILSMCLAIPSLIAVLKPILPGVKSKSIHYYMLWKIFEVFVCPLLDIYAMWQSVEFTTGETKKDEVKQTKGQVEK